MKFKLTSLLILLVYVAFGQDFIILKTGDEIESKVLEITHSEVKYKKFTNPDGPTYSLEKSKIFMIKYASGDKDIFKDEVSTPQTTSSTPQTNDPDFVQNSSFVFNPNIGSVGCAFKRPFGARIYGTRAIEVFVRQDIIYYGLDATYSRLTNKGKLSDGAIIIEKYMQKLHEQVNNEFIKIIDIRRWMKKPNLFQGTDIFSNYGFMDYNSFVVADNYCISFEDLQQIVKGYILNEKEGIGMVINLVNFNKHKEYVSMYVTFFDIRTRAIMYAVEVTGNAGGAGWSGHYANGINKAFREMFIDRIYKNRKTGNEQIHPKLLLN